MKKLVKLVAFFTAFCLVLCDTPAGLSLTVRAEESDPPAPLTITFEKGSEVGYDSNIVTINKNGTVAKAVHVMYSEDAYENNGWISYYSKGKQNTSVNGTSGYKTIKLPADSTEYRCTVAGYYNFWIQDQVFSVQINDEDLVPEPVSVSVTKSDESGRKNVVVIYRNDPSLTGGNIMFSGESTPAKATWVTFYKTGKQNVEANTSRGYKGFKFVDNTKEYICSRVGYYNFWIDSKLFSIYISEADLEDGAEPEEEEPSTPAPTPAPVVRAVFSQSGNVINIDKNGADITGVNVMFYANTSDAAPTTWVSYYTKGKENTNVNSASGYKGLKFNAEGQIAYTCKYPGVYCFWSQNEAKSFTVTAEQIPAEDIEDIPTPPSGILAAVSKTDNKITITKNGAEVTKAFYMYSDAKPTASWTGFVNSGKIRKAVNSDAGYKTVQLENENTVLTSEYTGWLNIWLQDKMYSYEITNEDFGELEPSVMPEEVVLPDPVFTVADNVLTIQKNGRDMTSVNLMFSRTPLTQSTWAAYVAAGKADTETNTTAGYKNIKTNTDTTSFKVFDNGHYYFWLNNKLYHVEATGMSEDRYAEMSISGKTVTVYSNRANASAITMTYSANDLGDEASLSASAVYEEGARDTEINTASGYVTLPEITDGKSLTLRKPGYYYFVITDDSGVHVQKLYLDPSVAPDSPMASLSTLGNVITVHTNDTELTSVFYMQSASEYAYTNFNNYVAKGKENTSVNGTAGYKKLSKVAVNAPASEDPEEEDPEEGEPEEEPEEETPAAPTKTFDGVKLVVDVAGYYTFQFTDESGKYGKTVYISQADIDASRPDVTVTDNKIKVSTEEVENWTLKSVQYIVTEDDYTYTTWNDFVATGKTWTQYNTTKGYSSATAAAGALTINCKAPGHYTLLINYVYDLDPTLTKKWSKTVTVDKYMTELRLSFDGASCNAGALITEKAPSGDTAAQEALELKKENTKLYLREGDTSNYLELNNPSKGLFQVMLDNSTTYRLYFGDAENKTELGTVIGAMDETIGHPIYSKKLNYYTTKLNLTDLDADCNLFVESGQPYRVALSIGSRPQKQLPLKVTVREEGQEIPYSYNNETGVINIPEVNGRITIKAMAARRYTHINIKLNSMGGNIYDASWGTGTNFVYSMNDVSGDAILLPTPTSPANSETVKFDGWYTDLNYSRKVTSINSDDYSEGQTLFFYAKWILSATSYSSSNMYYAYNGSVFDIRGKNGSSYIRTTYSDGGYGNYYYYNNGSAYPYARNATSNYGGSSLSFVNSTNTSIFKRFLSTNVYYAQVMANQGSYVTVNYIFVNTGSTPLNNLTFGACADVQIGTNDSASIKKGTDNNGTYLLMEDGYSYAFRLYTIDANQYWIGGYSSSKNKNGLGFTYNVFNNSSSNSNSYDKSFTSGDSALAFSFIDQTIPANSTVVKTVKLGVGTMADMGSRSGADVMLIGCGGTWDGAATKEVKSSASTVSLADQEPTRTGYHFVEWNTSSDGRGTTYHPYSTVGSSTLYAIWEKIVTPTYSIYNDSSVKNETGKTVSKDKADITIFYNSGQVSVGQADFEVDAVSIDNNFVGTIKVNSEDGGYCLPDSITVTVGDRTLVQGTDYVYIHAENSDTADLSINAAKLTSDLHVKAIGIRTPVKVPVVTAESYHVVPLKGTTDLALSVTNKDEVNQTYSYRWFKATTNVNTDGTAIPYYTDTLSIPKTTTSKAGTYYYYCVVTATRKDNKQTSKVVSDVITVEVTKQAIASSVIREEVDEMGNGTGVYSVSANPGKAPVTYTYYIDEDCTIKTSTEQGAGINGGQPTANGTYYVKALIAESANYLSYETAAVSYTVSGLPVLHQEGRLITLENNNSGLKGYKYMFSENYYEYTTWTNYWTTGKLRVDVNGKNGYISKTGTVEGVEVSSLDGTKISLKKAGYYTFLLTYGGGKTYAICVLVSESDLLTGVPYVTQENVSDNTAILVNNHPENLGSLKVARYIYTGDEEFIATSWANFVAKGKERIAANTSSGYKTVKPTRYIIPEPTEEPEGLSEGPEESEEPAEEPVGVLSLDGEKILLPRRGYYTFWLAYTEGDGTTKERQMVVYAGNDIMGVDSVGMNLTYFDTTQSGNITSIAYQYYDDVEPEIVSSGAQEFTSTKKVSGTVPRTSDRTEVEFQVDRYGWYLVQVKDSGQVGTKYYKVYVEPVVSDEHQIILKVDGGLITAKDNTDPTNKITKIKFATDENYKKGSYITANSTGVHVINIVDAKGFTYTLEANVLTLERSSAVNVTSLEKQITAAQAAIAGCQLVESTDGLSHAGTYATSASATTLNAAITVAQEVALLRESQATVDDGYRTLTAALQTFKSGIVIVPAHFITVVDNTIKVAPSAEEYALSSFVYNVNNKTDKVLTNETYGTWAGISASPYFTRTTFNNVTNHVFSNVSNGIYTFLITQIEAGSKKQYVEYGIVHVDTTEKAVATDELSRYIGVAEALLGAAARGYDAAAPGQDYTPETTHDNLATVLAASREMAAVLADDPSNTLEAYADIIPMIVKLHSAINTFKSKTKTRPSEEETELVINASDHNDVTISKSNLVRAAVAYGTYNTWAKFSKSGYISNVAEEGVVHYRDALYNGTYTALCTYSDGTQVYQTFEINSIVYPFTVVQENGKIKIDLQEVTPTFVGYQYGDKSGIPEEAEYLPIRYTPGTTEYEVPAMGNGGHSIIVKTADHTYYQKINVDTCEHPVIIQYNGKLGVFTHGFSYNYVGYKSYTNLTGYTTWDEMYSGAKYCGQNQWYDPAFFPDEKYTFYFNSDDPASCEFVNCTVVR